MVDIAGVESFKPKKLLKLMKNRKKRFTFSEKELPEDIKKIEAFYLNNGFLDVSVQPPRHLQRGQDADQHPRSARSRAASTASATPPSPGNLIYTSTELAKAIEYRRGKIFSQEKYEETVRGIQELYADRGRLRARINPVKTFNPKTDLMDVQLEITEGHIVYIDHVDVEGNKATKTHVLRREIVVKPGDMFRPRASAGAARRS